MTTLYEKTTAAGAEYLRRLKMQNLSEKTMRYRNFPCFLCGADV